jgi:hypothetical protein
MPDTFLTIDERDAAELVAAARESGRRDLAARLAKQLTAQLQQNHRDTSKARRVA